MDVQQSDFSAIQTDAQRICDAAKGPIDVAVVLGSGLADAIGKSFTSTSIPYECLRSLSFAPIPGHRGDALVGRWNGKRVLAFSGRAHLYQGFTAAQVTAGVRLAHACGAQTLILTNAAGALNPDYVAGDIMLIADHLNLTGSNPLVGDAVESAFVDVSDAYSTRLRAVAFEQAIEKRHMRNGVYAGLLGPSYETPAEAKYLRTIGADAAGMSTVLETIMARALHLEVVGFSIITNIVGAVTSHEEVTEVAHRRAPLLADLIEKTLLSSRA